jgi:hypothetical protein
MKFYKMELELPIYLHALVGRMYEQDFLICRNLKSELIEIKGV